MPSKKFKDTYTTIFESNGSVSLEHHIKKIIEMDAYLPYNTTFFTLINTTSLSFDYVSKNFEVCTGCKPQEMKTQGMNYFWSLMHPTDLQCYLKALKDLMAFTLQEIPLNERKHLCYTYNYRIKNGLGEYVHVIQNSTPVYFDKEGKPVIGMAQYTVLDPGVELPLTATVKYMNENNQYKTVFSKSYNSKKVNRVI